MTRRTVLNISLVLMALMTIAIFGLFCSAYLQKRKAEYCLAKVLALDLNRATFDDARRISDQFGGTTTSSINHPCTPEFCDFRMVFQNRPLSRLGLAPFAGLSIGMVVSKGGVTNRGIWFEAAGYPAYLVDETSSSTPSNDSNRSRIATDVTLSQPKKIMIRLTTQDPPELRKQAYAVKLTCLDGLWNCKEPLPGLTKEAHSPTASAPSSE